LARKTFKPKDRSNVGGSEFADKIEEQKNQKKLSKRRATKPLREWKRVQGCCREEGVMLRTYWV